VAQNRPCVITGEASGWARAARWRDDAYLRAAMAGAPPVAVNVTPGGRGDAVHARPEHGGEVFVLPQESRMPFAAFLDALDASSDAADADTDADVPYVSAQNGSLHADFAPLVADVPASLPWAEEAFASPPDAVNLWIGNSRAVTTFHCDHYENMYAVLAGEKRFTLLPPCDAHRLHAARRRVGRFCKPDASTAWAVQLEEEPPRSVSWARVDPHPAPGAATEAARAAFPRYFRAAASPLAVEVTLREGEILYLPALWHHHVRQAGRRVIAVNWWHDMVFDHRYAHLQLVRGVARALAAAAGEEGDGEDAEEQKEQQQAEEAGRDVS
jgi:jumonji domain-containing protein 7